MHLVFLLIVILLSVIGGIAFGIYEKRVESLDGDETKADDFEIIEE